MKARGRTPPEAPAPSGGFHSFIIAILIRRPDIERPCQEKTGYQSYGYEYEEFHQDWIIRKTAALFIIFHICYDDLDSGLCRGSRGSLLLPVLTPAIFLMQSLHLFR